MSMWYGIIHCCSRKQKLNTKITTESELIGTSEYVPFNIWIVMFYEAQGYEKTKNVLFQDNESAINIEKHGQESCTGNYRHIHIWHFFVKYGVDKEEIEVQFCPTHLIIADYFKKPLQGKLFKLFRDLIMGYKHIGDILADIESNAKERVGSKKKWQKIRIWKITINVQFESKYKILTQIEIQVRLVKKERKKKSISIKKSEDFFAAFRNVIRYGFQEHNQISSLSENNPVY